MGGSSGSSSSTYSPPPQVAKAYEQLLNNAQPLFTAPYQPYTPGAATTASEITPLTVAPQTPNQVAAGQNIASLAGYYQPYANAATDLVQQGTNPIQLQQFNNQAVSQYLSPYLNNVLGSTVANINETNAQQQQQVLGNAIAKGAYGGDRSGIAQAELARQQNLANNATLANIANAGYNSALGQFNQMNQQGMQAQSLSNQYAQQGAGMLGNLGSMAQNAAIQQAQAQYGIGQQQQQQRQAELSTAYQNYLNQIGYPYQQAQFEAGLISGVASGMGGTTTSTPAQPSALNQALGGLGMLGTMGNIFGGSSGAAGAAGAGGFLSGLGGGIGSALGGLGEGIGSLGAGILGIFSDERMKENVHPVGKTYDGQNIYKFNYKGDPTTHIGLMAQEVEHKHPSAVGEVHGLKTVNYDNATKEAEHRGHFALGGDAEKQMLGVSPIAGMSATSYLPTSQVPMANLRMPQAPQTKDPNEQLKSNLKDAVTGMRTLMGKPDPNAPKTNASPAPTQPSPTPPAPPVTPQTTPDPTVPPQDDDPTRRALGGRAFDHHYDIGGMVRDTPASDSMAALKASQQHYAQSLPSAGVVPTTTSLPTHAAGVAPATTTSTPTTPSTDPLKNPGLAYNNYNTLATSGKASLADLQAAYNTYMASKAPGTPIEPVKMGTTDTTPPKTETSDTSSSVGGGEGGGGGNFNYGGVVPHHYSDGGIANYMGMPTKKSLEQSAIDMSGSGVNNDLTLASIAAQEYLPEQAARGGVISGREHHAGPDETNGESNVVGKREPTSEDVIREIMIKGVAPREGGNNPQARLTGENAKNSNASGSYGMLNSTWQQAATKAGIDWQKEGWTSAYMAPHDVQTKAMMQYAVPHARALEAAGLPVNNQTMRAMNFGPAYMPQVLRMPDDRVLDRDTLIRAGWSPTNYDLAIDNKINKAVLQNPDGSPKTVGQLKAYFGDKGGQISGGAQPSTGGQERTQPVMPTGVYQTPTKEGLSGALGISMTDNQRLAAFNAFAKLAGTPGKFGVGLAAAADTYAKTLMEGNKQTKEAYAAQSEAELRKAQEIPHRVSQKGLTTQVATNLPGGGINIESQITTPGTSTPYTGQGQPSTGAPATGAPGAPTAPTSPEAVQKISSFGPVSATDESRGASKLSVMDDLAKEAIRTNATDDKAIEKFHKKYDEIQAATGGASQNRGELAAMIRAVSEAPVGGLAGYGPASAERQMINRYINLGLQSFGAEGFNTNEITQSMILKKQEALAAQGTANSIAAASWLKTLASSYPSTDLDEGAAKKLTATAMVNAMRTMDMQNVADEYGRKTHKTGWDIENVFNKVNDPNLYATASNDLASLMMRNGTFTTPDGKTVRGNPVSAYLMGKMTDAEFDDYARKAGSSITNLSRFVPRQRMQ
jgi:hypothetical protein